MNYFDIYDSLISVADTFKQIHIAPHIPRPTETDRDVGYIERYFVQRITDNNEEVIEVDRPTYDRLENNHMYRRVMLTWRIAGALDDVVSSSLPTAPTRTYTGVKTANRLTMELAAKDMPAIMNKLRNLTQYWLGA